jgi:hypothetical protein
LGILSKWVSTLTVSPNSSISHSRSSSSSHSTSILVAHLLVLCLKSIAVTSICSTLHSIKKWLLHECSMTSCSLHCLMYLLLLFKLNSSFPLSVVWLSPTVNASSLHSLLLTKHSSLKHSSFYNKNSLYISNLSNSRLFKNI